MSTIGPNGEIENEGLCDGSESKSWKLRYRQAHRKELAVKARLYYREHKDERKVAMNEYYLAHRAKFRSHNLKYLYGLTEDGYLLLEEAQGGRCAICRRSLEEINKSVFCVDHSHESGDIRGLLCPSCNSQLGFFEKNKITILSYLKE